MRISVMTYSLAQQGGYAVGDYVRHIAASGAEGINWVTTYGRPARELRQMSLDAGLEVSCYTFPLLTIAQTGGDWRAEAKAELDAAAELGAPRVMVVPMRPRGVDDLSENRRLWLEVLAGMHPWAQERRIALTIENFQGAGSAFVTSDELSATRRELPWLRFTYDAGNAATGGEAPAHGPRLLGDAIEFVHFKDYLRDRAEAAADPRTLHGRDGHLYTPAVLGEGDLGLEAALAALKAVGYDGWLDVEYEGAEPPAHEAVAAGVRWYRERI